MKIRCSKMLCKLSRDYINKILLSLNSNVYLKMCVSFIVYLLVTEDCFKIWETVMQRLGCTNLLSYYSQDCHFEKIKIKTYIIYILTLAQRQRPIKRPSGEAAGSLHFYVSSRGAFIGSAWLLVPDSQCHL